MLKREKISARQFRILVILSFVGTTILLVPSTLAAEAKQDAWIAAILGLVFGLLLVWFYNIVGSLFPNITIIEYQERLFGKWIGKFFSLLFASFLFLNCSTILFTVGDFITTQLLPETPIQFTILFFLLVAIIATRLGLEVFARAAEILFFWVFVFFIILILFLLPELEFKNLQPIFENGMRPILRGAIYYSSYSSMTNIVLLMIFPTCVNNIKQGKKAFYIGTFEAGILILFISLYSILVLGHDISSRSVFPTYILAKKISIGDFIERIEVIIAFIWFITVIYKTILYFYGSVIGFAQILNLKDYRPLTLPLGMILIVLSLTVFPSTLHEAAWTATTWIPFILTFSFFLPLLVLIVSVLKKKIKGKR